MLQPAEDWQGLLADDTRPYSFDHEESTHAARRKQRTRLPCRGMSHTGLSAGPEVAGCRRAAVPLQHASRAI
jgi:hypothetical protein